MGTSSNHNHVIKKEVFHVSHTKNWDFRFWRGIWILVWGSEFIGKSAGVLYCS